MQTSRARVRPVHSRHDRKAVVDDTFDNPHFNTKEDIEWIAKVFDTTEQQARDSFINADFLFSVETLAGKPIYIVAVTPQGMTQTAMTPLLESYINDVTRLLRKLAVTVGDSVFKGTVTGCEWDDYRARWINFLGFEPVERRQYDVPTLMFRHVGVANTNRFRWADVEHMKEMV